jgi:subtilisin family serine protease
VLVRVRTCVDDTRYALRSAERYGTIPVMRPLALLCVAAGMLAVFAPATSRAADPRRGEQWGLDMIEAGGAHAFTRGTGAVVAVVDTGALTSHEDLAGSLQLPGADFVDGDSDPQDGNGHGTHVAGIVSASTGNGLGVESVAPDARVLPVRVLGDDGSGSNQAVAAGILHAVDQGAQVVNLSLGEDLPLSPLGVGSEVDDAIDQALDRGAVVVAASGNSGLPVCNQPSGQARLLCVGAVDRRGLKPAYSNYGEGLGISAPGGSSVPVAGEDILSTWNASTSDYRERGGTSQAAPHVAGVAALLVARGLRGQEVVHRILATATDAGRPGPDELYGAGIVNARAAVAAGGPGAGPGGNGSSSAFVSAPRRARIATLLRRGLPVRCRAAGSGRCTAHVVLRRRTVAKGSAALRAGETVTVRARATRRGRRALRRVRRRARASLRVSLPGSAPVRRPLTLRR